MRAPAVTKKGPEIGDTILSLACCISLDEDGRAAPKVPRLSPATRLHEGLAELSPGRHPFLPSRRRLRHPPRQRPMRGPAFRARLDRAVDPGRLLAIVPERSG